MMNYPDMHYHVSDQTVVQFEIASELYSVSSIKLMSECGIQQVFHTVFEYHDGHPWPLCRVASRNKGFEFAFKYNTLLNDSSNPGYSERIESLFDTYSTNPMRTD